MYKRKRVASLGSLVGGAKRYSSSSKAAAVAAVAGMRAVRTYGRPASARLAPQTKYFDTSQSFTLTANADWTGSEVTCSNYVQNDGVQIGSYTASAIIPSAVGAGYGEVVGNRYLIKKVRARGQVIFSPASDTLDMLRAPTVRVCMVLDTQPNGAQAQGEDVFNDMGAANQNVAAFMAMGAQGAGRFRILKDLIVSSQLGTSGTDGTNTNSQICNTIPYDFTWAPTKGQKVALRANLTAPAITGLVDVNVFLLAIADHITIPSNLVGCARCYYTE